MIKGERTKDATAPFPSPIVESPDKPAPGIESVPSIEERLFLHEDGSFQQRTDLFLVAHGTLVTAFVNVDDGKWASSAVIWAFGLTAAYSWCAVALRQLPNLDAQKKKLERTSTAYGRLQRGRRLRDRFWRRDLHSWPMHATTNFGIIPARRVHDDVAIARH